MIDVFVEGTTLSRTFKNSGVYAAIVELSSGIVTAERQGCISESTNKETRNISFQGLTQGTAASI